MSRGDSGHGWWGRAVVVCASVAALAGAVAVVATAASADGEQAAHQQAVVRADAARADAARADAARADAARLEATRADAVRAAAARTPAPTPAADTAVPGRPTTGPRPAPGPERLGAPDLRATLALLPGWTPAPGQDLVPVPSGRFPTVVTLADRATVLLGRLDPGVGPGRDALTDEARRLVGAFTDGAMRQARVDGGRIADVSDAPDSLDGRDAHTVVRRVTSPDGDGPLVRVTTVAARGPEPGLVLLGVADGGPRQAADGTSADQVVRSLASGPAPATEAALPPRAGPPTTATRPGPPSSSRPAPAPVSRPAAPAPPGRGVPPTDR
jgi:hypothetical protein